MANPSIEALRRSRYRRENLTGQDLTIQKKATVTLVQAAHDMLEANKIDRDPDFPEVDKRWDAFFAIPDQDAVMVIQSVGDPNELFRHGLFVYIHSHKIGGDGRMMSDQVVGLQTAKHPTMVGESEAIWLSAYNPEQLEALATIIRSAVPISKDIYTEFVKPQDDLSRVSF